MDQPRYNIRAVERMTGVPAPTLRSWERRYGFPAPRRTATARRLYSDRDVDAIRWLKAQTERGLSVAQAVRWAQEGRMAGAVAPAPGGADQAPDIAVRSATAAGGWGLLPPARALALYGSLSPGAPGGPAALVAVLVETVAHYDEAALDAVLSAAFARHPADAVLAEVLTPALVAIGARWARGDLSVSAEHFASNIIRRRLLALLGQQPAVVEAPTLVLACVPGEQHELGLLMLAVFLRWAGARVVYLGADVPVADLVRCLSDTAAEAVCLSAVDPSSIQPLAETVAFLRQTGVRVPVFAGGAGALAGPAPPGAQVPGGDLRTAAGQIMAALRAS